jgi:hypothetical protein
MTEPADHSSDWKSTEQSARLLHNPAIEEITGVSWQNVDREEVKKELRDGGSVAFSASSTLEMHPVVVLGGGDAEWVSCALGKENLAGAHCNHCNRATKDFHLGRRELWTLASLAARGKSKERAHWLQRRKTSRNLLHPSPPLGFTNAHLRGTRGGAPK